MGSILDRVLKQTGDPEIVEKLLALPRSDLNSLLLNLFERQASGVSPAQVLKACQTNRFAAPSAIDPAAYHALEARLLTAAQQMDMQTVLLSPAAPLGSCSAFGFVDQYNVVSALRGTELLSDPSNILALTIANRLKTQPAGETPALHYATTARVTRAQAFSGKGRTAHFGLLCLVSAGRDTGSYACESALLEKHLLFYGWMREQYNARLSVVLRARGGYTDGEGFIDKMSGVVRAALPGVPLTFNHTDADNRYYRGVNFNVYMEGDEGPVEVGDGGFVDWINQLLGSRKQRCLISGIGLDRLLAFDAHSQK